MMRYRQKCSKHGTRLAVRPMPLVLRKRDGSITELEQRYLCDQCLRRARKAWPGLILDWRPRLTWFMAFFKQELLRRLGPARMLATDIRHHQLLSTFEEVIKQAGSTKAAAEIMGVPARRINYAKQRKVRRLKQAATFIDVKVPHE